MYEITQKIFEQIGEGQRRINKTQYEFKNLFEAVEKLKVMERDAKELEKCKTITMIKISCTFKEGMVYQIRDSFYNYSYIRSDIKKKIEENPMFEIK